MNRFCPICSCPEKTLLYQQNFGNKAISLMENYDVVVCRDCGFVYADKIPSQAEFNHYYAVMSKYEFDYQSGLVSNDYLLHFKKIVDFLTPHLKDKKAKILDIGCSTGCLLSLFKQKGYSHLLGIDPSPSCVRTAKEKYHLEASANNLSNFNPDEKFDLLILSAVLEHLVNLRGSVQKIRSLLKDQGLLLIEVPDAQRFDSYIFSPFQQFSIEHINYFSQYSLKNLLSSFSFKIIKIQKDENRINQTIDPDIFALARKSVKYPFKMIRDTVCEPKLKNYLAKCFKMDSRVEKIIQEKIANKDKIIVWGVGTHTQRLVGAGLDLAKILYFVDSNPRYKGKKIKGIEIKSPQDIKEEEIPILISTYSYQKEVIHQIKEDLKLNNEIIKIYQQ